MRPAAERSTAEEALLRRIIAPGKPDGTALTPMETDPVEWLTLRQLLIAGDVRFDSFNGRVFIHANATVREIAAAGYLKGTDA